MRFSDRRWFFVVVILFLFSFENFSQAIEVLGAKSTVYEIYFPPILLRFFLFIFLFVFICESIIRPICLFLFVYFSLKVGWEK